MSRFQNYAPKVYAQTGSPREFIPYLSVLDALMNIGPKETLQLIANGTECWSSWSDMVAQSKVQSLSSYAKKG